MGPNSFRNLTYLAVLAVVGALVYLIYQSSKKKSAQLNPSIETPAGLGSYSDTLGSIVGSSPATLPSSAAMSGDTVHEAVDGTLQRSRGTSLASDVKDVTVNDPGSIVGSSSSSASSKSATKPKSPATTSRKSGAATPVKFDSGTSAAGEYMVIAGVFSSKDNALAQVAKLKKLGFVHAEGVKLENSANTYAIAGYYQFKGGADAAVRTLKANKMNAYARKRVGEIYKPSSVPVKPSNLKPSASKPS